MDNNTEEKLELSHQTNINLDLTAGELSIVLKALDELPRKHVAAVYEKIEKRVLEEARLFTNANGEKEQPAEADKQEAKQEEV